jgi:hypothetical protein
VNCCSPATAPLVVRGRTYKFRDGFCQSVHVSGILLDVTLGTIALGRSGTGVKGNSGKPYFRLDLSPGEFGRVLSGVSPEVSSSPSRPPPCPSAEAFTSSGTFKSIKTPVPGAFSGSGSWNCHGVFVKD